MSATVTQTVCGFFEERELTLACEFLYRSFAACSCYLVRQIFKIYGVQRSASSRVLRAFAAAVRGKALFEIIRPAGIERAVFALKNVDTGAPVTAGQIAGIWLCGWFFSTLSQSCYLMTFFGMHNDYIRKRPACHRLDDDSVPAEDEWFVQVESQRAMRCRSRRALQSSVQVERQSGIPVERPRQPLISSSICVLFCMADKYCTTALGFVHK